MTAMSYASVAVLSDVHGVLPALDAVLAEPDVRGADRVVVTGDIADGPQPVEVLYRLGDLGDRVTWVRGNADREMVEFLRTGHLTTPDPVAAWAARQLRPEQVTFLEGLPTSVTLEVGDLGPVLFWHATPRDDEEVVLVDSRMDRWAEVYADLIPRSARSCAATPTCRSSGWPTGGSSSTRAASACPTGGPELTGRCSALG